MRSKMNVPFTIPSNADLEKAFIAGWLLGWLCGWLVVVLLVGGEIVGVSYIGVWLLKWD